MRLKQSVLQAIAAVVVAGSLAVSPAGAQEEEASEPPAVMESEESTEPAAEESAPAESAEAEPTEPAADAAESSDTALETEPVEAAPVAEESPVEEELPEVVVPGAGIEDYKPDAPASPKYTEPLRNIPQTITIIPASVIEDQGATTLRDVLRNVPGISIQAGEGGVPAGDNLSIRGFNARTDIFIDGVRDFGGYSRDSFNFEQVEVSKGPASVYAGRGGTGGTVNMASKTPREVAFQDAMIGMGTENYKRATVDINQPTGIANSAFRFNALIHDADTPDRDIATNSRWAVAPALSFGLDTPTRLHLYYFHMSQDNMPDYGIPWVPNTNIDPVLSNFIEQAPPVDFSNYYGLVSRDYERIESDLATMVLEHDLTKAMTLRNLFRYGRVSRDSIITAPRFADVNPDPLITETTTVINRQMQSRNQVDMILTDQLTLTSLFQTGPVDHALVSGIEVARETSDNRPRTTPATASQTDIYNPNPYDGWLGVITPSVDMNESTANSLAVYVFDTMKFGEKLEFLAGLRWDYFGVDYNPTGAVAPLTLGRIDRELTWRTGIVFKPVEIGSIYAAYGTSFNPAAEGLTLSTTATAAANLALDPEKSNSYEIGTKWDLLDERLAVSAALFRTDKTNARTEDPTNPGDVLVLDGRQRVDGVELGIAGGVTPDWDLFAGYTFLKSEILSSNNAAEIGNELSNTPAHSYSIWTVYRLPGGVELGGGAQYVGPRFSNNNNLREADSYTTFDAMASYRVNEHFTVRANGYNLADASYIDQVGGGHFVPGPGRSATVTAELEF